MLFDETQDQSSLSQHESSLLTQKPPDPPPFLPLFFGAHQFAVPSSLAPGALASLQPSEGSPAIVAASSDTFGPSGSLLHDSLPVINHPTSHPTPPLDDTRIASPLNLPSHSPIPTPDTHLGPDFSPPSSDFTNPPQTDTPPQCTHNMTTRSMNQIFKPKQIHTVSKHPLPQTIEPTSVSQAISQPHWCEAMSTELTALMKHGTWDLVLPPSNCTPVGCKWVFRVKRHADGSVDRFKACLVAKGYDQRPGIDYKETFSPMVKPASIRTVLSIVVMKGWDLRQMDVNNAFLNGALIETVFMAHPPGFKDLSKPNHVCRLKKAIYGLKQAPRAWYTTLKNAILQLGFHSSKADSSLFNYSQGSNLCYFLVYVDDIVIIGNNLILVAYYY